MMKEEYDTKRRNCEEFVEEGILDFVPKVL